MVGISKLYCATVEPSDVLRYSADSSSVPSHILQFSANKRPVVVWNVTKRCNLRCVHCYSKSMNLDGVDELSTDQGKRLLDDLAGQKCPVVLFSGGEPLMRQDLMDLIRYAHKAGLRAVISTNGTLITPRVARELKSSDVSYVGVSIDGIGETNDRFRCMEGAFNSAIQGIRNCKKAGIKVGLRFTVTKSNRCEIPAIFHLLEQEDIPRACFYHLVYTGRGKEIIDKALSHAQSRKTVHQIIDRTADLYARGVGKEILTVGNHADGVYLYLRLKREGSSRAASVLKLLQMNGGNNSGIGIGSVSWDGNVYADQFWRNHSLGNIKQQSFSEIWNETGHPLIGSLRNRKPLLKGRCSGCVWKDVCNGNMRVRAEAVHNDIWAEDPACYLTEQEIAVRV